MSSATASPAHRDETPRARSARRVAIIAVGLEAVGMLALASVLLVRAGTASVAPQLSLALGIFLLIFAAALIAAVRSLVMRTRFGVGYGITWQLFQALVGASMLNAALIALGVMSIGLALMAFVALFILSQERAEDEIRKA